MRVLLLIISGLLYIGAFVVYGVYNNHQVATTMFLVAVILFNIQYIMLTCDKLYKTTKMKAIKMYNDIIIFNVFCALVAVLVLATYFLYQLK
jgi:hypothetical protein